MREKKERVCKICGKAFVGVNGICACCNQRRTRSRHTGEIGCMQCGGMVTKKRGLCRKCFWDTYRRTVRILKDKRGTVGEYSTEGIPRGY
jgi:predicted amidophosphoribosyltransferase